MDLRLSFRTGGGGGGGSSPSYYMPRDPTTRDDLERLQIIGFPSGLPEGAALVRWLFAAGVLVCCWCLCGVGGRGGRILAAGQKLKRQESKTQRQQEQSES